MRKLFLSLAACVSILSASASGTWQLGPYAYSADTLFHATTGPGITTTGVRLSSANGANKTNIFYSTIDLTNPDLELRGVQAQDNGDKVESVLSMGNRKNKQGNGQYLAGVNSDFFNMGGSPTRTNGHSIVDGTLYNAASGGDGWNTWASYATVTGAKDVIIDTGVKAERTLGFPNDQKHSYRVNGKRYTNYLVIYTPDSTSTGCNQYGFECPMKLVSGSIAGNDAVFEITEAPNNNGNTVVPQDGFVLSGHGDAATMMEQLKVGDKVSLGKSVTYNGRDINPTQSIGGCSMIVMDGQIAPDSYFSANIVDHFVSNQARTVIGYNEDRTKLIIMVADKYASYAKLKDNAGEVIGTKVTDPEKLSFGTSTGMVLQRMGHIMLHLGCYTAMNFDGGGSSQLYNKELGIRNVPYGDTYLRPVANGFFAVSTTPVETEVAMIEVYQKNVKLNEGETFTPTVFGYDKYGVLINKNVTGFTLSVAPEVGAVNGTTLTAGAGKKNTKAVVEYNGIKCGVMIAANGGGDYVTSGDDNADVMVKAPYTPDEALGTDKDPIKLIEEWSFVNTNYNDGWDGTAPDWTSADAIKAKPCPRFATARNGHFYTVDMKTMSIAEIDSAGNLTPLYKLPSLEGRVINGVPDYYGCAISSDDAGNFLIGHLFTKTDTYRIWTVYNPVTGKAKHFDIELPAGEGSNGRIDNVGRVVGDLTKDAYVYVAPKATANLETQKALIIHFTGDGEVDNVTATRTMSKGLYLAGGGNQNSTMQPRYATVADMAGKDIDDTYYWYSKAEGLGQWNQDLFTRNNGVESVNYAITWNNTSGLNGFDTFEMGGKRYFVVGYATGDEKKSGQHIIIKDEQSTTIAEWNNDAYSSTAGFNTITAVPVNPNKVEIYVYNCTGDFFVGEEKTGAIAGALLTFQIGDGTYDDGSDEEEIVDITPSGLDFDSYEDGDIFKIFSTESNGTWSGPANFYHEMHPDAFDEYGQLTSLMYRGMGTDLNCQANVDAKIQPMVTVRKVNDQIGNALVINEQYSPLASIHGWAGSGFNAAQPQFSFFVNNHDIKNNIEKKHYVRVRLVYNVLYRGCHYAADIAKGQDGLAVKSIYATHEGNWVVPGNDHLVGAEYADGGIAFAKWVNETGRVEDIPENPVVYVPTDDELDPYDPTHLNAEAKAYLMNAERFRVYEFDTYIDNPSQKTISVQFNILDRNITYIIKEIKFLDLGTNEEAATLLGKRQLGWQYFADKTTGIEDIVADEVVDGEEDAPAVYYNLQGVEVRNPENGIYIVRRGNKVTKEYVR